MFLLFLKIYENEFFMKRAEMSEENLYFICSYVRYISYIYVYIHHIYVHNLNSWFRMEFFMHILQIIVLYIFKIFFELDYVLTYTNYKIYVESIRRERERERWGGEEFVRPVILTKKNFQDTEYMYVCVWYKRNIISFLKIYNWYLLIHEIYLTLTCIEINIL